ncbi:MAG: hypothetical protein JNM94_13030 [Phycisphaerae bacterium]|nr:hypothetical protein [Phycisphaerae bacterium]
MHGALVVAALLLVAPPAHGADDKPQPPAVAPEKVAALADAVAKALPADRRVECRVDLARWNHEAGKPAPDVAKDPPLYPDSFVFRMFGPQRTIQAKEGYAHVQSDDYHYSVATSEWTAFADRSTGFDPYVSGVALALQVDAFGPLGGGNAAADVIRTSIPLSLAVDGSRWTYVYDVAAEVEAFARTREKNPNAMHSHRTVVVDMDDPPRVLEIAVDLPRIGDLKQPRTDRFVVEEWQQFDGRPIARVVRREVTLPATKEFPTRGVQIQRTTISKVAIIPADVPAPPPVADGTVVQDRKLDLEFTVGSRDIVYQKRELRLKEPLKAHPGDRLEELLKTAEPR